MSLNTTAAIICIDTETGGLDCLKHPMAQIALQSFHLDTFKEISRFDTYIQPYADLVYQDEALKFNGITMSQIKSGLTIKETVAKLCEEFTKANPTKNFRKKPILLGHNITFDIGMIMFAFRFCKVDISKYLDCKQDAYGNEYPVYFDTMWLARAMYAADEKMTKYNLTACSEKAGVEIVDAHSAQNDIIATKELFVHFISNMRKQGSSFSSSNQIAEEVKRFPI